MLKNSVRKTKTNQQNPVDLIHLKLSFVLSVLQIALHSFISYLIVSLNLSSPLQFIMICLICVLLFLDLRNSARLHWSAFEIQDAAVVYQTIRGLYSGEVNYLKAFLSSNLIILPLNLTSEKEKIKLNLVLFPFNLEQGVFNRLLSDFSYQMNRARDDSNPQS